MASKRARHLVYEHREEIHNMIVDGNSSLEIKAWLNDKGVKIEKRWLRHHLKKFFPQYVVNGRWNPLDSPSFISNHDSKSHPAIEKSESKQANDEITGDVKNETHEKDKRALRDQAIKGTARSRGEVIYTFSNGLEVYEDIQYVVSESIYKALKKGIMHEDMLRASIVELVPGRQYLRKLEDEQGKG